MKTLLAMAALLCLLLALLLVPGGASATPDFWGTLSYNPWHSSAKQMHEAGVDYERINIIWSDGNCAAGSCIPLTNNSGHPNRFWTEYDKLFLSRAQNRIRITPTLYGSTASITGSIHRFPWPASKAYTYWRNFAAATVLRYKPGGVFWKQHPRYAKYAPTSWEIWNEPNLQINNPDKKYPARAYARFLRQAAGAVRWADPAAKVVFGGLAGSSSDSFLQRAHAEMPDLGDYYDALAVHPYAAAPAEVLEKVQTNRETLDSLGGTGKGLWINELGWATADPTKPVSTFTTTRQNQATYLRQTFNALFAARDELAILGVYWYFWKDANSPIFEALNWDSFCGLLQSDGKAKPALQAFRQVAQQ